MNEIGKYIRSLMAEEKATGKKLLWKFYKDNRWLKVKNEILKENHNECYICKSKGIITRYDYDKEGQPHLIQTVHHVHEVKEHPDEALNKYYIDDKGIEHLNLIVVCKRCHNELHHRYNFKEKNKKALSFSNEERW